MYRFYMKLIFSKLKRRKIQVIRTTSQLNNIFIYAKSYEI